MAWFSLGKEISQGGSRSHGGVCSGKGRLRVPSHLLQHIALVDLHCGYDLCPVRLLSGGVKGTNDLARTLYLESSVELRQRTIQVVICPVALPLEAAQAGASQLCIGIA